MQLLLISSIEICFFKRMQSDEVIMSDSDEDLLKNSIRALYFTVIEDYGMNAREFISDAKEKVLGDDSIIVGGIPAIMEVCDLLDTLLIQSLPAEDKKQSMN
jgi:hypothetical protein